MSIRNVAGVNEQNGAFHRAKPRNGAEIMLEQLLATHVKGFKELYYP